MESIKRHKGKIFKCLNTELFQTLMGSYPGSGHILLLNYIPTFPNLPFKKQNIL